MRTRILFFIGLVLLLLSLLGFVLLLTRSAPRETLTHIGSEEDLVRPTITPSPPLPSPSIVTIAPSLTPSSSPPPGTPTQEPSPYLNVTRQGGILGNVWNLADIRYGLHPDRLRVVWEMSELRDQIPRFEIVEVDNTSFPFPTGHDPSWGAARIDLVVSDLYARNSPLIERLPLTPPDNRLVTRIGLYPTFSDSQLGFSIGLKTPAAYEVYELTDPVRVVIDVLYGEED